MARPRDWETLKEATRRRYQRYGITPSYYERGGTLQRARGHLPREHVTRRERNPKGLTSGDYRFLKNQQRRAKMADFSRQTSAYRRLSPRQRGDLRRRVAADHREYKRQKSISGVVRGEGTSGIKAEFRQVLNGGGGGGDYDDEGDDNGGGGGGDDYEELDFEDYENIYPDFDDDLSALMFYH